MEINYHVYQSIDTAYAYKGVGTIVAGAAMAAPLFDLANFSSSFSIISAAVVLSLRCVIEYQC